MAHKQIYYSDKYTDDLYEYRHVVLPRELAKQVPKSHLMSEDEWRRLGVQQSLGWVHYMIHEPGDLYPSNDTNNSTPLFWNISVDYSSIQ
ncbi:Cyclin-dependent kinases regulatory subunit 2 [Triplophysa tibetana]|uniref:Cyclin-dependent kinases regulatory subunit n=1 Tax=Triplophysa tibetana TaxID=1572043 RepID=A0A5A9PFD8_9TELE|nr:Cyclin-dependent kinases regulatory subunit 2 [Triplophysa tibetana]